MKFYINNQKADEIITALKFLTKEVTLLNHQIGDFKNCVKVLHKEK